MRIRIFIPIPDPGIKKAPDSGVKKAPDPVSESAKLQPSMCNSMRSSLDL